MTVAGIFDALGEQARTVALAVLVCGCGDKDDGGTPSSTAASTTEADTGSTSIATQTTSSDTVTAGTSASSSSTTEDVDPLEALCPMQADRESCEAVSDEEQYRCYWLEIDVLASDCTPLSQTARCEYLPWAGDGVTLGAACEVHEPNEPGVAYRPVGENFETLHMYIYGASIQQVDGWTTCDYPTTEATHPICSCFCGTG